MFWGVSESLDLYLEYLNSLQAKLEENVKQKEKSGDQEKTRDRDDATKQRKQPNEENEYTIETNEDSEKIRDPDEVEDKADETNEHAEQAKTSVEMPKEECDEESATKPRCLNILLFGAADPRHVIKTMSKLYTHRAPKNEAGGDGTSITVNFYMLDGCMEIVARNIVLLGIALESPEILSLRTKVHLFMDVYGNTLTRPASHQYLVGKSKTLLKVASDNEVLQKLCPMLNIENLKYRERDGLQNAFDFWLPKEGHFFNIEEYWGMRLRKLLGVRYDYREGAFDWDLSMTLKGRDANQICSQEYRYFRETGIAFTFPEYEQCKPNKTLAAGLVRNGEQYIHRGYVGDIQTGPFCAYGLKTPDERMTKSFHGDNDYRATDVTERNLLEYFYELQTNSAYNHDVQSSRKYGCVRLLMGKRLSWNECDLEAMQDYDKPWIPVEGVKVHFLSANELSALQDASDRWREFFDVVFVGYNYDAFMKDSFVNVLRENGLLLMETKLLTVANKKDVTEFETKLLNFAKTNNLKNVINYGAINAKNSILKFKKTVQKT